MVMRQVEIFSQAANHAINRALPDFKIKPSVTEFEIKLPASLDLIYDDNKALRLFQEIVRSLSLSESSIKSTKKTRAILETDKFEILKLLQGFLTLTYAKPNLTKQRFKNVGEILDLSILMRKERTANIYDEVTRPIPEAFKSERIRTGLTKLADRTKIQGVMKYHSYKAPIVVEGASGRNEIIAVSLDRGLIYPRFDLPPIPFCEFEFDSEITPDALQETAHKVQQRYDFEISTTPKEKILLENSDFLEALHYRPNAGNNLVKSRFPSPAAAIA